MSETEKNRVLKKFSDDQIQTAIDELMRNARALEMVLDGASFKEITIQMGKSRITGANDTLQSLIRRANNITLEAQNEETFSLFLRNAPYPENLLCDIFGEHSGAYFTAQTPPDIEEALEYVLSRLSDKERTAILMMYQEGENLTSTAKQMGLTHERIRQLCRRALGKMRHPSLAGYLINGYANQTLLKELQIERQKAVNKEKRIALLYQYLQPELSTFLREHDRALLYEYELAMAAEHPDQIPAVHASIKIQDINLSNRAMKCLLGAGIETLEDLALRNKYDLLKLKAFGLTTLKEVEAKLAQYGLSLRPDEIA